MMSVKLHGNVPFNLIILNSITKSIFYKIQLTLEIIPTNPHAPFKSVYLFIYMNERTNERVDECVLVIGFLWIIKVKYSIL